MKSQSRLNGILLKCLGGRHLIHLGGLAFCTESKSSLCYYNKETRLNKYLPQVSAELIVEDSE